MRLTTKALCHLAMLDLAMRDANGPVTPVGISERQGISLSYLEQLFGKLRRAELVESVRGRAAATVWRGWWRTSPWPTSSSPWTSRWTPPSAAGMKTATTIIAA